LSFSLLCSVVATLRVVAPDVEPQSSKLQPLSLAAFFRFKNGDCVITVEETAYIGY
jgi:hypothetical protein